MNTQALVLFHELMKKGYIARSDNSLIWSYAEDEQAREALDQMGEELGFEILPAQDRLYLVPTKENDLFLKNTMDYRSDIKASSEVRTRDLYLLNYLAIFILYMFFSGQDIDAQVRDFITKDELIEEFSKHCKSVTQEVPHGEDRNDDYSESFLMLAQDWLSKKEGDAVSRRMDDRYGVINRILLKFRADELFVEEEGGRIRPTRKTKDLMPYVLRKERVQMINHWIEEEEAHAADQQGQDR